MRAVREDTASGSLALALAAVGVHTAAMRAPTGVMAEGACRGFEGVARRTERNNYLTVNGA